MERRKTRQVRLGSLYVGGDAPVTVQSMTNTDTSKVDDTVEQVLAFKAAGCDISRSAINSEADARAIPLIKERTGLPFVADIQFDYRLALLAVHYGCDGLRINPGNIGGRDRLEEVVQACKERGISMRVGVNSGSLSQSMIDRWDGVNVQSLAYSALAMAEEIEKMGLDQLCVSIKSSHVSQMIEANRLFSEKSDIPLHLGVTEAGPPFKGTVKSSVGIGSLLSQGIGDTIRVSLTGDPVEEVRVGNEILQSLGLKACGVDLISCPTCARTKINLIQLAQEAEKRLDSVDKNITVAIMGCPVNGPGEAREADIGIAGNLGQGVLFKKGRVVRQLPQDQLLDALMDEIEKMDTEKRRP